ncbi:MAG: hypothetical protein JW967_06580 [Dehalococcoidales bacterium]|nr:hypothetical protein [Dehalococcoidales bacterium]
MKVFTISLTTLIVLAPEILANAGELFGAVTVLGACGAIWSLFKRN